MARRIRRSDEGTRHIRFAWDYSITVPLWGTPIVTWEPSELESDLGLSVRLVHDIVQWGVDMQALDLQEDIERETLGAVPDHLWFSRNWEMELRARALVKRLRSELGDDYQVEYEPWLTYPDDPARFPKDADL